jgi:hypothetical protein
MYVQPLDGPLGANSLASPAGGADAESTLFAGGNAPAAGDNISRFLPPWLRGGNDAPGAGYFGGSGSLQGIFGPLMGVLTQLMQVLQSLMGYGCNPPYGSSDCSPYDSGGCSPYGNERYFRNATGSSDGDPHLSFNGASWDNMKSQPNLLSSDSFAGGYRISTQVTPPNGKGATWNQSATVTLDNGATTVSMNNKGDAQITRNGQTLSIARGQTLQLGNGESVTCEQNGSLRITAENGVGGRITTTLSAEGHGVNVDVTAHDVDLGGTLVNGYERREHRGHVVEPPSPEPVPTPILGPIPPPPPIPRPVSGGPVSGGPILGAPPETLVPFATPLRGTEPDV